MRVEDLQVTMERVEDLVPYARNAKKHTEEQVRQIANSIREFGFADPVGVWRNADGEYEIVEGHGRVLAAQKLGMGEVPVIRLDALTDEERRAYMLAHNQLTMNTGWNEELLDFEIDALEDLEFDLGDFGFTPKLGMNDLQSSDAPGQDGHLLADDFIVPPFSVLNAREGAWQERKHRWIALGIESELGRGGGISLYPGNVTAVPGGSPLPLNRKGMTNGNR